MDRRQLAVDSSGATGTGYGPRVLELTRPADCETHPVAPSAG